MTGVREPATLLERVRSRMSVEAGEPGPARLRQIARAESQLLVDATSLAELAGELSAEMVGAGPLERLLRIPGVTDVLVNSADQVWIDRGEGLERADVRFSDDRAVRRLACRLAVQAGRRLDDAAPFVDAVLPDGTRLHAILPPLVAHPSICLRVLARRRLTLADLIAAGSMSDEVADLLVSAVRSRLTVLISGGAGTGKTTLLAALLAGVDPIERIITIEDAAELAIAHPHVIALVARPANIEGSGSVTLRDLVCQALRMRGDRLVVGEFRGAEIAELLSALNTGHAGGAATVHANSARDVPNRLVALGALAGLPSVVLMAQAQSAFDLLAHVARSRDGLRRVEQIALWPRGEEEPEPVWSHGLGLGPGAATLRQRFIELGAAPPSLLTGGRR